MSKPFLFCKKPAHFCSTKMDFYVIHDVIHNQNIKARDIEFSKKVPILGRIFFSRMAQSFPLGMAHYEIFCFGKVSLLARSKFKPLISNKKSCVN